jgi:hypothetical protein
MSCLALTIPAATECAPAGSIQDVLVIPSSEVLIGAGGIAISNVGVGAHTITAINTALDFRRINFDQERPARAASEQTNPGQNAFTHTVSLNISSDETAIEVQLPELSGCCGFVVLVLHSTGRAFAYGLNYSRATGVAKAGAMKAQVNNDTGEEVAGTEVGSSITFTSTRMNYQRIPIAAGVFELVSVI